MLLTECSIWKRLADTSKPIVLYGMGDGADKILDVCNRFGIPISGVFANDAFVRGQSFRGFPVQTLAQTAQVFSDFIVLLSFATSLPDVMQQVESVASRYELYAPDVPVCGEGLFTDDILLNSAKEIDTVYSLLADEKSKQVFKNVLSYKYSGKLSYLRACETPKAEAYSLLNLTPEERYVDAGAYNGDTVEELLHYTKGSLSMLLALEPDARNFKKLVATAQNLGFSASDCHNVAAWHEKDTLFFSHRSGRQASLFKEKGVPTPANSIDNLLEGHPCTLIKYDVEGAERNALAGSSQTITQYKPRLIVSLYHRNEDLFSLPLQIHALRPDYRMFMRHHPYFPAWDTNLYCV